MLDRCQYNRLVTKVDICRPVAIILWPAYKRPEWNRINFIQEIPRLKECKELAREKKWQEFNLPEWIVARDTKTAAWEQPQQKPQTANEQQQQDVKQQDQRQPNTAEKQLKQRHRSTITAHSRPNFFQPKLTMNQNKRARRNRRPKPSAKTKGKTTKKQTNRRKSKEKKIEFTRTKSNGIKKSGIKIVWICQRAFNELLRLPTFLVSLNGFVFLVFPFSIVQFHVASKFFGGFLAIIIYKRLAHMHIKFPVLVCLYCANAKRTRAWATYLI